MGQRIGYYRNYQKKGLKDIIFENFAPFREWYLDREQSSLEDFDEQFGNETIKNYFKRDPDFKFDFHKLDKKLIDELVSEFIGVYWDLTFSENKIFEFFGPTMSTWRYRASCEMVLKTNDEQFIRLWNYIITKGRSLRNNADFDSYTNEDKIGFLAFDEQRVLKAKIETYFGNIEQIRQRYLTDHEILQKQKPIENSKNGGYSFPGHNPKSAGLEYVLDVLNEMTAYESELITVIE